MANVKITDLTAYTDPVSTDVLPIVDVGADVTKKVSIADLLKNASAGTAAAPGIAFDGDNTGIYSPGADQVAISTGGTGRLFVDSAGRVGLGGASSPVDDLHISTTNPSIVLEESDAGTDEKYWRTRVDNGAFIFEGLTDAFGDPSFWLRAFRATNSEQVDNIQFATSGSERLRITSDGRLGLGTSSPQENFDLAAEGDGGATGPTFALWRNSASPALADRIGTIHFDGVDSAGARVTYKSVYGQIASTTSGSATGDLVIGADDTGANAQVVIDSSGKVGIGTTSPTTILHLEESVSGDRTTIRLKNTSTDANSTSCIRFDTASDGTGRERANITSGDDGTNDGYLAFQTRNTSLGERARIDSSGRLLVGTSSDSGGALLQVNGNRIRVATAKTPSSASDTGTAGEICWDADYIYVCTATNTWKRTAISTW